MVRCNYGVNSPVFDEKAARLQRKGTAITM